MLEVLGQDLVGELMRLLYKGQVSFASEPAQSSGSRRELVA